MRPLQPITPDLCPVRAFGAPVASPVSTCSSDGRGGADRTSTSSSDAGFHFDGLARTVCRQLPSGSHK